MKIPPNICPTPLCIDKARWWSLSNRENPSIVFYGTLAANLIDVMTDTIPTAATDGVHLFWNPDFVKKLSIEEVRFVLLHEGLHCGHQHLWRLPRDTRGNIAGDYAINLILSKLPGIKMPQGGLLDTQYEGLAEEEILAKLPKQNSTTFRVCGTFTDPAPTEDGKDGNAAPDLQKKWEGHVIQAEFTARALGAGDAPHDMQRILDRVRVTKVDWRAETADFLRQVVGERADWSRSSRRMATQPVIYPRRRRDATGLVVVARDTSGSIDNALCAAFSEHLSSITADLNCSALVLDADTQIQATYRLAPGEPAPSRAVGGGGTDFRPVLAEVDRLIADGEPVAGVIYLTDGDGEYGTTAPAAPLLWAIYNSDRPAPFGRTVKLEG